VNHDQVKMIEHELEEAIALAIRRLAQEGRLDEPRRGRTYHLMAKAAVAVLEAVDDVRPAPPPRGPGPRPPRD
jgi:hypothetical protein